MKKISIIVPIYNVENYLEKCLDSLVNQSLKDIEIIAINDGSTDCSYNIATQYAKKNKNIKLINQENHGLSYTRNVGLSNASGKYIMFIDSDDYIDLDTCQRLYDFAEKKKADIVTFDLKYVYEDGSTSIIPGGQKQHVDPPTYIHQASSAANKMYNREFLNKINFEFKVGIWSEDVAIIPSLVIHTNKIYYLKNCFYYYVQRNNSITHQEKYNKKTYESSKSLDLLADNFKKYGKYEEYYEEIEYMYIINYLIVIPLKIYRFKEGIKDIKKLSKKIKENYPNWRKNKYYKKLTTKEKIYCWMFYYNKPKLLYILYRLKNIIRRTK